MPRLRRSDTGGAGFTRRRAGKGWTYLDPDGAKVTDPAQLQRFQDLAIPPAWKDVWICPWPNGHIQALGTDAAGRRQYLYHPQWRAQRDAAKHDRVLEVAACLPRARERVAAALASEGLTRERVLAAAFRLLDLGFFRVGSESYAEDNGTFGLATMRREHVTVDGDVVVFDYIAKHGKQRVQAVVDPAVRQVVRELCERDDPAPELLAWWDDAHQTWRDVKSSDVNDYVREALGVDASAKDFRTWHATVLMAVALAVSTEVPASVTARKRAVSRGVTEVSSYLGNTAAVCRKSYIDPRVIDLYDDGITVRPALDRLAEGQSFGDPATHGAIEAAVLQILREDPDAAARKKGTRRAPKVRRSVGAAA
ncbi:MAG: DNA topoisomerase IB [Actinomycetales bacterium]